MIHYDSQYSEGESPCEPSPDIEALNASSGYSSQGIGTPGAGWQSQPGTTSQSLEQIKNQAMQKGNELTQEVKTRASTYLDQQKGMAADVLQDVTEATRHCCEELQQKNHPRLSEAITAMADRMQDFSQSLRRQDMNYFVTRTQDFARQRPVLFLGGALALGFLAVRFLKSSGPSTGEFESRSGQSEQSYIQGIHDERPASSGTQFTI